ncbi:DUF4062 domain-containing protein [Longimicrobium sp.]|uniref:DUF4062 domain-containing protein n=1 Tax=Longimicrobium sp. TaxID=2029185 RepID=UPI002E301F0E|nr:DUF4062 domain-containing protein [Longimicrobium sp.]HEX6039053.1 DUF4062 domain-containing protein [Longimicrobium sp.]
MSQPVQKVRIFISSEEDVQQERDALGRVIAELNLTLGGDRGIVLEPVTWETHAHPAMGRRQAVISEQIGLYDIFIGIMWWRFGKPTGVAGSATEEEFRRAYGAWEHGGSVDILFYFSQQGYRPRSSEEADQLARVVAFQEELDGKGLVFTYPSAATFADVVRPQLARVVMKRAAGGAGAPPAPRDLERATRLIVNEVLSDLAALDARLGQVLTATRPDAFNERMRTARGALAPSVADAALSGYRRLIAEQRIGSLRQALNATLLRTEFGAPLLKLLADSEADVQPVRVFYDQLAEVQWATEALMTALGEAARNGEGDAGDQAQARVGLAIETLEARSESAHLAGLVLLRAIGASGGEVEHRLAGLTHLRPAALLPAEEVSRRMDESLRRQTALARRREQLLANATHLRDEAARAYEALEEDLEVRPTDTWSQVVGKAVSLRQLGRVADAVAAFARYGEMFRATDPAAADYARVAQAFTLAMGRLGVSGGMYVYQLGETSAGHGAGLAVGDVVIEYNGRRVSGSREMTEELGRTRPGDFVRMSCLRLHPSSGRFTQLGLSVEGGPLGAGLMPV